MPVSAKHVPRSVQPGLRRGGRNPGTVTDDFGWQTTVPGMLRRQPGLVCGRGGGQSGPGLTTSVGVRGGTVSVGSVTARPHRIVPRRLSLSEGPRRLAISLPELSAKNQVRMTASLIGSALHLSDVLFQRHDKRNSRSGHRPSANALGQSYFLLRRGARCSRGQQAALPRQPPGTGRNGISESRIRTAMRSMFPPIRRKRSLPVGWPLAGPSATRNPPSALDSATDPIHALS